MRPRSARRHWQLAMGNSGVVGVRLPMTDSRFPIQNPAAAAGVGCRVSGIGHRFPDDDMPIASGGASL